MATDSRDSLWVPIIPGKAIRVSSLAMDGKALAVPEPDRIVNPIFFIGMGRGGSRIAEIPSFRGQKAQPSLESLNRFRGVPSSVAQQSYLAQRIEVKNLNNVPCGNPLKAEGEAVLDGVMSIYSSISVTTVTECSDH